MLKKPLPLERIFSLKHDFPNKRHLFVSDTENGSFNATIKKEHFPYFTQGATIHFDTRKKSTLYRLQDDNALKQEERTCNLKNLNDSIAESTISLGISDVKNDVLVRDKDAAIFLVVPYSLEF